MSVLSEFSIDIEKTWTAFRYAFAIAVMIFIMALATCGTPAYAQALWADEGWSGAPSESRGGLTIPIIHTVENDCISVDELAPIFEAAKLSYGYSRSIIGRFDFTAEEARLFIEHTKGIMTYFRAPESISNLSLFRYDNGMTYVAVFEKGCMVAAVNIPTEVLLEELGKVGSAAPTAKPPLFNPLNGTLI